MKKRFIISAVIILVLSAVISVFLIKNYEPQVDKNMVIGEVNGISVYYGELYDEMNRNKAKVISDFSKEFSADANAKDFWNTDFNGITPISVLRKKLLIILLDIKFCNKKQWNMK